MTNKNAETDSAWKDQWTSDIHHFLLSDADRMDAWVAFRKEQEQLRADGIDTTKPRKMIKMADHIYFIPPDKNDERSRPD